MSTVTVETDVTLTPRPLPVDGADEVSVLVQLWVRSEEWSWSGCLTSEAASALAERLDGAARAAASRNAA